MAQAGTLDVRINADPTGMIRGFGRSQAEVKKFERSLNTSTRSISGAFTNMAVDFAASGEVGARGLKRMAESAIGLAGLFGPQGLLVAGIAATLVTLMNFHDRAREAAEKTRAAYKNLLGDLSTGGIQRALEDFAADPKRGGQITKLTRDLEKFTAARDKALESRTGRELVPALERSIQSTQDALAPLLAAREALRTTFREIAASERGIEVATTAQAKAEDRRRDALRESARWAKEILDSLSKLEAPLKLPSVWEDLKQGPLVTVDAFDAIKRNSERAKEVLRKHAEEWEDTWGRAIDSTTFAFSNFFSNLLSGQVTKFRDFAAALLGIWLDMIAQMLAAQATAKIFDFLGIAAAGAGSAASGASAGGGYTGPLGPMAPSAVEAGAPNVTLHLNVTAMDGPSVARTLQSAQGEIVRLVAQGIQKSRQAQRDIRGN